jgi:hypothetical protein
MRDRIKKLSQKKVLHEDNLGAVSHQLEKTVSSLNLDHWRVLSTLYNGLDKSTASSEMIMLLDTWGAYLNDVDTWIKIRMMRGVAKYFSEYESESDTIAGIIALEHAGPMTQKLVQQYQAMVRRTDTSATVPPMSKWELDAQVEVIKPAEENLNLGQVVSTCSLFQRVSATHDSQPVVVKLKRWKVDELLRRDVIFYQKQLQIDENVDLFAIPSTVPSKKKRWSWKFWARHRDHSSLQPKYASRAHETISIILNPLLEQLNLEQYTRHAKKLRLAYRRYVKDFKFLDTVAVLPANAPVASLTPVPFGVSLASLTFDDHFGALSDHELVNLNKKLWKLFDDFSQEAIFGSGYFPCNLDASYIYYDRKADKMTLVHSSCVGKLNRWQQAAFTQLHMAVSLNSKSATKRILERLSKSIGSDFNNWDGVAKLVAVSMESTTGASRLPQRLEQELGFTFGEDSDFYLINQSQFFRYLEYAQSALTRRGKEPKMSYRKIETKQRWRNLHRYLYWALRLYV